MNTDPTVIALDFDGVIAKSFGFVSKEHAEEPNTEVLKAIQMLKAKGC